MKKVVMALAFVFLLLGLGGCQSTVFMQNESGKNSTAEQTENTGNETQSPGEETPAESDINKTGEEEVMKISVKSADYEIIYKLNNSNAAKTLYEQLPLTTEVEPFSSNEMTFYPPQKLDTSDTPLSSGEAGTLSYYSPWGDVVMFYDYCNPNGSLYGLGEVISGKENIERLSGTVTISEYAGE